MKFRARIRPWSALILPPAAWYAFQQGLAMTLRGACPAAGVPWGPVFGVCSLLLCMGAVGLAVPRLSGGTDSDRFVARMALLSAGLFAIAIVYQALATLIVPPCAR